MQKEEWGGFFPKRRARPRPNELGLFRVGDPTRGRPR